MGTDTDRSWIGFDLGGTKMLVTHYNDRLEKQHQVKMKTMSFEGGDASLNRVITGLRQVMEDWKVSPKEIGGVGIGVPGALDMNTGTVINAPNLGWQQVPLKELFEKVIAVPIFVINDVDAGTYGEYKVGAARGAHCVLGVFPGTGIGGSCIYDGKILRGSYTTAMEIGHIQVMEDGLLCGCGKRGCLETVASRLAIAGQAAIAGFRGDAPALVAATGCDIRKIKSGALASSIANGDVVIGEIVRHAAHFLGKGIAVAINMIAPDVVVLGGGLVEAMPALFQKEVVEAIEPSLFKVFRNSYRLVTSELGDDAVTVGAASFARESITR